MDAWHEELARETAQSAKAWDGLGMAPFAQELPDRTADAILQWTIHELCSSQELEAEGKAMNNCVATYIESCAEGKSSIWSLRIAASANETARRVMTIEVDPETKTIVQARGKCNVVPSEKQASKRLKLAPNLLRQWASQAGLRLSSNAW